MLGDAGGGDLIPDTSPRSIRAILRRRMGIPPYTLWRGESAEEYNALYDSVMEQLAPRDGIEEVLTSEFVNYTWEVRRYRQLRASYMSSVFVEGLEEMLTTLLDDEYAAADLVNGWRKGQIKARKRVELLLSRVAMNEADIQARTLVLRLDHFERIDRMLLMADQRRITILREMERRRSEIARRARFLVDVEDAEVLDPPKKTQFTEVSPISNSAAHGSDGDTADDDQANLTCEDDKSERAPFREQPECEEEFDAKDGER